MPSGQANGQQKRGNEAVVTTMKTMDAIERHKNDGLCFAGSKIQMNAILMLVSLTCLMDWEVTIRSHYESAFTISI